MTEERVVHVTAPQGEIMCCKKRFRIVNAGRRFGKSFLSGYEMLMQAVNKKGSSIVYVAPTLPDARNIMWRGWLKEHIPQAYLTKSNEQMMYMEFKNGSFIRLASATDPDSVRGTGIDLLVIDEAAMIQSGDLWQTVRPNLSDKWHDGRALIISTPKGYNWFYDLFEAAKHDDEWGWFQFTTIEGGNVSQKEIESAKKTMSRKMFEQEYLASFETMSNRVYFNYDKDKNSISMQDWYGAEKTDIHVGIDFNVNPMTATIWAIDKDPEHNEIAVCFDEIVDRNSDTQALADEIKRRYPACRVNCYPDPTCRKRQTNAVGGVTDMDILQRNGFDVFVPYAPYATRDKFNCVNTNLCNATGFRRLYIAFGRCPELRKSWDGYTYKDKQGVSEPDKSGGLDHVSDSAAYFINYKFPIRDRTLGRPVILGM